MVTYAMRNIGRREAGAKLGRKLQRYSEESWAGDPEMQRLKYGGITITYYKKGAICIQWGDGKVAAIENLLEEVEVYREEYEEDAKRWAETWQTGTYLGITKTNTAPSKSRENSQDPENRDNKGEVKVLEKGR